jgi:hypothetical protein
MQNGFREAMSGAHRYTLVVRARGGSYHPRPWSWEICRDGEPLPARLREEGFATEYTATASGNVALRYFLAGLAEEEAFAPEMRRHQPGKSPPLDGPRRRPTYARHRKNESDVAGGPTHSRRERPQRMCVRENSPSEKHP